MLGVMPDAPQQSMRSGVEDSPVSSPPSRNGAAVSARSQPTSSVSAPHDAGAGGQRGWRNIFHSLKYREFRFLWLGMVFLMIGIQMQMIVRGYLAYELTSSPFILGLVNAGFAVPMLTLALFGGAVADRMERRRVIQLGQLLAAVLALFVALSIVTDTVTWVHLLTVSMIQGVQFSFLMPAHQSLVPQLVGRNNLTNALSLDAAAMSMTTLLAPALGGGLYNVIGPDGVYFLIAGCALLAVLFTSFVSTKGAPTSRLSVPMASDIREGLGYVVRSPIVLTLLVMGLTTALPGDAVQIPDAGLRRRRLQARSRVARTAGHDNGRRFPDRVAVHRVDGPAQARAVPDRG